MPYEMKASFFKNEQDEEAKEEISSTLFRHKLQDHPKYERMVGLKRKYVIVDIEFKCLFTHFGQIDNDNEHIIVLKKDYEKIIEKNI